MRAYITSGIIAVLLTISNVPAAAQEHTLMFDVSGSMGILINECHEGEHDCPVNGPATPHDVGLALLDGVLDQYSHNWPFSLFKWDEVATFVTSGRASVLAHVRQSAQDGVLSGGYRTVPPRASGSTLQRCQHLIYVTDAVILEEARQEFVNWLDRSDHLVYLTIVALPSAQAANNLTPDTFVLLDKELSEYSAVFRWRVKNISDSIEILSGRIAAVESHAKTHGLCRNEDLIS